MGSRGFQQDSGNEILSEINIIPLVDISLVLMLIFMVTANYIMTSSFTIDIAQAAHAKAIEQTALVTISISREGPVYLENEQVTSETLKRKMQVKYKNNPDISILLSVDKNVDFRYVVNIIDCLSELGIAKLNIAAATE